MKEGIKEYLKKLLKDMTPEEPEAINTVKDCPEVKFYGQDDYKEFKKDFGEGSAVVNKYRQICGRFKKPKYDNLGKLKNVNYPERHKFKKRENIIIRILKLWK